MPRRRTAAFPVAAPIVVEPLDFDDGRFQSALGLDVAHQGGAQYAIAGSDCTYFVSVDPHPVCCCPDATQRNLVCKHLMAAMLAHGVPGALAYATVHRPGARLPRDTSQMAVPALSVAVAVEELARLFAAADAERRAAAPLTSTQSRGRRGGASGVSKSSARMRELTGWVATHPSAGLPEWRALATRVPAFDAQAALIRLVPAIQDAHVRRAIIQQASTIRIIQRLMPFSAPDEFRFLFRRLVELGHHDEAITSLEDPANTRRHALTATDITPLLTSAVLDIRTRAFLVLDTVDLADEATMSDALQDLTESAVLTLPPPLKRRRTRR
jgi:hypothetical protein